MPKREHTRKRSSERTGHDDVLGIRSTLAVVGDRIALRQCRKDGILAACASPDEVLITCRRIAEHGGHGNIVIGALTGLVVCTEAPGEAFAFTGDGETVVTASGDHSAGSDARDLGRANEDASFVPGVADDVVVGDGGGVDSGLTAIKAAPDEALAVLGRREGVVDASREVGDGVVVKFEVINNGWGDDNGIVLAGVAVDAGSTKGVGAPGPHLLFAVNGKGVIGATRDQTDVLTTEAEEAGVKRLVSLALHLAEAELILLTRAPGVDNTFVVASESVVGTGSNVDDFLKTRK